MSASGAAEQGELEGIVDRILKKNCYAELDHRWPHELLGRNIWTRGLVGAVRSGDYDLVDRAEQLLDPGGKHQYLSCEQSQMARGVVNCARLVRALTEHDEDPTEEPMRLAWEAGHCFTASCSQAHYDDGLRCPEPNGSDRERINACFRVLLDASDAWKETVALTMAWDLCRAMIGEPRNGTD